MVLWEKALPGRPLAKVLVWSLSIFKLSLSSGCESPDTSLLLYQLKKCEDVSMHGGMDVMESRPHADVCSHDLSAAVGTVGIPRERPQIHEVRTVEHLEHHDRALLELKPD